MQTGATPAGNDMTMALVHVGFGSTILLAVLARLYLRYRYGAPGHAPGTSPMQAKIATCCSLVALWHADCHGDHGRHDMERCR